MYYRRKHPEHSVVTQPGEDATAADLAPSETGFELIYSPLETGEYTDERGVRWQLRDEGPTWARLQFMMLDHTVPVVHADLHEVREIADNDRTGFLATVRPYLKALHSAPPVHDADLIVAEFSNGNHRAMLMVVNELC